MIRIIHQTGPAPVGSDEPLECWILDGVSYRTGARALQYLGWEWVSGPQGGAWITHSADVAGEAITAGIPAQEA